MSGSWANKFNLYTTEQMEAGYVSGMVDAGLQIALGFATAEAEYWESIRQEIGSSDFFAYDPDLAAAALAYRKQNSDLCWLLGIEVVYPLEHHYARCKGLTIPQEDTFRRLANVPDQAAKRITPEGWVEFYYEMRPRCIRPVKIESFGPGEFPDKYQAMVSYVNRAGLQNATKAFYNFHQVDQYCFRGHFGEQVCAGDVIVLINEVHPDPLGTIFTQMPTLTVWQPQPEENPYLVPSLFKTRPTLAELNRPGGKFAVLADLKYFDNGNIEGNYYPWSQRQQVHEDDEIWVTRYTPVMVMQTSTFLTEDARLVLLPYYDIVGLDIVGCTQHSQVDHLFIDRKQVIGMACHELISEGSHIDALLPVDDDRFQD